MTIKLCVITVVAFLDKIVSVCYFLVIIPTKNPQYISARVLANLIVQVTILVVILEVMTSSLVILTLLTPVRFTCQLTDGESGSRRDISLPQKRENQTMVALLTTKRLTSK